MKRLPDERRLQMAALIGMLLCLAMLSGAQADTELIQPEGPIPLATEQSNDRQIEQRIRGIFAQMEAMQEIAVSVQDGVALISGQAANEGPAQRALQIAGRVEGVVAVEDTITRTLDLQDNLNPLLVSIRESLQRWSRALPLVLVALLVFALVAFAGHQLARRDSLWARLTPNPFLAELASQAVRLAAVVLGLLLALNLLGATALMGTILGSAGVLGLAISFAVKDSMENYISSIMLSVRQPFRASDHVVINEHEGVVMRLTSRSTVLMTLDGNHLRIPNSTVFKSVILNYTRNPQRRFEFALGVDAGDDPADAMAVGLDALSGLEWVLHDPAPYAIIETVGDSNIVIRFMAWVDQRNSDYGKARSLSIRAAKNALERKGFTLPEPIYRLRLDDGLAEAVSQQAAEADHRAGRETSADSSAGTVPADARADELDVAPETHVSEKVLQERHLTEGDDLLDPSRPVE
mgnify:CR=1 FL=1